MNSLSALASIMLNDTTYNSQFAKNGQLSPFRNGRYVGGDTVATNALLGRLTEKGVENKLASSMEEDWALLAPQIEAMFGQQFNMLHDNSAVRAAQVDARQLPIRTNAIQQRQLQSAGVNLSPSQKMAMDRQNAIQSAGMGNAMYNSAQAGQYDQNNAARSNLLSGINAMKNGAQGSLTQIVNSQSNRNNAYRTARTNHFTSMLGQGAGALGMMAFM